MTPSRLRLIVRSKQDKNFISVSSFATKWYITLFVNTISFSTQLRIWDAFLLEGVDVIVVVSTAIIWSLRSEWWRRSSKGRTSRAAVDDKLPQNTSSRRKQTLSPYCHSSPASSSRKTRMPS